MTKGLCPSFPASVSKCFAAATCNWEGDHRSSIQKHQSLAGEQAGAGPRPSRKRFHQSAPLKEPPHVPLETGILSSPHVSARHPIRPLFLSFCPSSSFSLFCFIFFILHFPNLKAETHLCKSPSIPGEGPLSGEAQKPLTAENKIIDERSLEYPVMEAETSASHSCMGRTSRDLTDNGDSSSSFSDCNSDRSGEFPSASTRSRRLWPSCAAENADDLIRQLVSDLESTSIDEQKQAALEIRLLAKNKQDNRLKIASAGAIKPLISLISSSDQELQEYGVTAILNLSLCDENKELIAACGAIKPLVRALRTGSSTAKENAACALLRLSQFEENKIAIGRCGGIPPLVNLLENGGFRGKKDASTVLYSLCSVRENKLRALQAGVMKPLIEFMADFGSNMVDKSAYVLNLLVSVAEGRAALVEEGGIPVLVELVEVGSQRQKEIAAACLLHLCEDSILYRTMVAREGAIPPLVDLSQSGARRAKEKAETLLELLRQPKPGSAASIATDT
ncbi:hypothetical protein Nepgr_015476 [Nepenthes gracilis]|uniref:RING-type E3 ubiquitin transferase n=1 Tax=Nepenthes gracilis TaxID=150966 RepID=A0AAD3XRK4_NEPGR|nr:hypothetical protein Nepgr_015476 [Nepenthes gracilis]